MYDDEGNQTKRTTKATGAYEVYVWDYHNHLTRVEFRNAANTLTKGVNYRYDAFGRLIERTVDGDSSKTLRFVYDDAPGKGGLSDVVLTFDANGNVVNRYLHGPSVDQLFSDESAVDGLLWALADRQGTVTDWLGYDDVANTTSVYDHVEYDSFGNKVTQTNGTHTITLGGYTGRWRDAETGLTNHRDRWTQGGRWLSEDGDGFSAGDVNLRRYVGNGPTNYTDPSGRDAAIIGDERNGIIPGTHTVFIFDIPRPNVGDTVRVTIEFYGPGVTWDNPTEAVCGVPGRIDLRAKPVKPGSVIVIPGGKPHRVFRGGRAEALRVVKFVDASTQKGFMAMFRDGLATGLPQSSRGRGDFARYRALPPTVCTTFARQAATAFVGDDPYNNLPIVDPADVDLEAPLIPFPPIFELW